MKTEVPDIVLLTDYANTKLELEAYKKLSSGFATLSVLPENADKASLLYFQSEKYHRYHKECGELLAKLEGFMLKRGLPLDSKKESK